jgi:Kef-type potassium/proton antiporter, CPA2 family (TC 2.A.37.1)
MPAEADSQEQHNELSDHLIILGFGIGGKLLARAAKMANIPILSLK